MKFLHLGDLHIGKSLNQKSLLEVQEDMLNQALALCQKENIKHVIIAGDVYDKQLPSLDAVKLLNNFLTKAIEENHLNIYMIAGNHDSLVRLNFLNEIVVHDNLHIASTPQKTLHKVTINEDGKVYNIYMLPYFTPNVYNQFVEDRITSYQEMIDDIIKNNPINKNEKNILVTHHLVTNEFTTRSDSEQPLSVGGLDNISADSLKDYDYVALGHLHCPQHISYPNIRYSGSLLKYSDSEVKQPKYFTIVELDDELKITKVPFKPLREVKNIEGTIDELLEDYQNIDEDYVYVTLTDKDIIPNAMQRIRVKYPNAISLRYKDTIDIKTDDFAASSDFKEKNIKDQFTEFYEKITQSELSDYEMEILESMIGEEEK